MRNTVRHILLSGVSFLVLTAPVFAQGGASEGGSQITDKSFMALALALGMAIAAGLAALGDSRAIAAACEGAARNPGASARIQTLMLIGVVLIETLVLFTLGLIYIKIPTLEL